jgi:hypothetical protein
LVEINYINDKNSIVPMSENHTEVTWPVSGDNHPNRDYDSLCGRIGTVFGTTEDTVLSNVQSVKELIISSQNSFKNFIFYNLSPMSFRQLSILELLILSSTYKLNFIFDNDLFGLERFFKNSDRVNGIVRIDILNNCFTTEFVKVDLQISCRHHNECVRIICNSLKKVFKNKNNLPFFTVGKVNLNNLRDQLKFPRNLQESFSGYSEDTTDEEIILPTNSTHFTSTYDCDGIYGALNLQDLENIVTGNFKFKSFLNYKIKAKNYYIFKSGKFFNIKDLQHIHFGNFILQGGVHLNVFLMLGKSLSKKKLNTFLQSLNESIDMFFKCEIIQGSLVGSEACHSKTRTGPSLNSISFELDNSLLGKFFNFLELTVKGIIHPFLYIETFGCKAEFRAKTYNEMLFTLNYNIALRNFHFGRVDICKSFYYSEKNYHLTLSKESYQNLPNMGLKNSFLSNNIVNYNSKFIELNKDSGRLDVWRYGYDKLNFYNPLIYNLMDTGMRKSNFPIFTSQYLVNDFFGFSILKDGLISKRISRFLQMKNVLNDWENSGFGFRMEMSVNLNTLNDSIWTLESILGRNKVHLVESAKVLDSIQSFLNVFLEFIRCEDRCILNLMQLLVMEIGFLEFFCRGGNNIAILPSRYKLLFQRLTSNDLKIWQRSDFVGLFTFEETEIIETLQNLIHYNLKISEENKIVFKRLIEAWKIKEIKEFVKVIFNEYKLNMNTIFKCSFGLNENIDSEFILSEIIELREYFSTLFSKIRENGVLNLPFLALSRMGVFDKNFSIKELIDELILLCENTAIKYVFKLDFKNIKSPGKPKFYKICYESKLVFNKMEFINEIRGELGFNDPTIKFGRRERTYDEMARVIVGREMYGGFSNWECRVVNDVRFGFTFTSSKHAVHHILRRIREKKDLDFIRKANELAKNFTPLDSTPEKLIYEIYTETGIFLTSQSLLKIYKLFNFENSGKRKNFEFEITDNLKFYRDFILKENFNEISNMSEPVSSVEIEEHGVLEHESEEKSIVIEHNNEFEMNSREIHLDNDYLEDFSKNSESLNFSPPILDNVIADKILDSGNYNEEGIIKLKKNDFRSPDGVIKLKLKRDNGDSERYLSWLDKFRGKYVRKKFRMNDVRKRFFRTDIRPSVLEFQNFMDFLVIEGILAVKDGQYRFVRNK